MHIRQERIQQNPSNLLQAYPFLILVLFKKIYFVTQRLMQEIKTTPRKKIRTPYNSRSNWIVVNWLGLKKPPAYVLVIVKKNCYSYIDT